MKSSIPASFRCSCSRSTLQSVGGRSRRHASTSSSASSTANAPTPSRKARWLAIAFVSVAAASGGAYVRAQSPKSSELNPETFTKYCLVSREPVSPSSSLFTLRPKYPSDSNYDIYEEAWRAGVWSVMFKQPQLQIGREYTPLPTTAATGLSVDEENEGYLRFFIRKDPFGEVSRYLHTLNTGADIELRGPKIECAIPEETRKILFIAGGTGIAPALQAGYSLLNRTTSTNRPQIHIVWASRLRADCLGGVSDTLNATTQVSASGSWFSGWFGSSSNAVHDGVDTRVSSPQEPSLIVRELEALKSQYPGQVTVDYYLDEENRFIGKQDLAQFIKPVGGGEDQDIHNLILVSGPEGFISYMAGPKVWAQGTELQGPLRGIIKELNPKGWAVWKL
ncbi:hypothetical protein N7539_003195 [Penicillium diatomitis]|uniref:FAD-binding FR-type domain-containing protein n=1 Tax=Penicillium diatomitis TaxID=2819901 RepID=A0A9W9XGU8_9EURO|nr:uncharacterized protein N7539_003195 [Penicillium diatomitis]KAJ5491628.1 hypothetical protein N7539_003195 [Penicillium diatomitis]